MRSGRLTIVMSGTLALIGASGAARAACEVRSDGLTFGIVDTQRGTNNAGMLTVSCDEPTSFSLAITSGGGSHRRMSGPGGDVLTYQLYTDSSRTTVWGDGNGVGEVVFGQSDGDSAAQMSVYGTVPPQSAVQAGEYRDELTITVQF